jgi:hypothetical protein
MGGLVPLSQLALSDQQALTQRPKEVLENQDQMLPELEAAENPTVATGSKAPFSLPAKP